MHQGLQALQVYRSPPGADPGCTYLPHARTFPCTSWPTAHDRELLNCLPCSSWYSCYSRRGQLLVAHARKATRPSPSIFQRVQQDLLPDGSPNTPWRRLLIRIRSAQTLTDLLRVWRANQHKTLVWRPVHGAVLLHRAALLAYPAALLAPQQLVASSPATANTSTPPAAAAAAAAAATAKPTPGRNSPGAATRPTARRTSSPQHSNSHDSSSSHVSSRGSKTTAALPAGLLHTSTELQSLLDAAGPALAADAAVVKLLDPHTLIRLLASAVRLHCTLPSPLQQALVGELLREAAKKLVAADVALLTELVHALAVLQPPGPRVAAAVVGTAMHPAMAAAAPMVLTPPTVAAEPHTGTPAGHASTPQLVPAGDEDDEAQETDEAEARPQQQQLGFREYLTQHAQHGVPNPLGPPRGRVARPRLAVPGQPYPPPSQRGPAGDVHGSDPAAAEASRLALWMEVSRAALAAVTAAGFGTGGAGDNTDGEPRVYVGDCCRLAAALAQVGCLPPLLADALQAQLTQGRPSLTPLTPHQGTQMDAAAAGGVAAMGHSSGQLVSASGELHGYGAPAGLQPVPAGTQPTLDLLDWSHLVTRSQPSHLCDAWHVLANTTAAPAAVGDGSTAGAAQWRQHVSSSSGDSRDEPSAAVLELPQAASAQLPHHPALLADIAVTLALHSHSHSQSQSSHGSMSSARSTAAAAADAAAADHASSAAPPAAAAAAAECALQQLLAAGGCVEQFLWLLPEASMADITRMVWALAMLAGSSSSSSARSQGATQAAHGEAAAMHATAAGAGQGHHNRRQWQRPGQGAEPQETEAANSHHTLHDVLHVLIGFLQSLRIRFGIPQLVCLCESLLQLQPHLPHDHAADLFEDQLMRVVHLRTEVMDAEPLQLRVRLLQVLLAMEQLVQEQQRLARQQRQQQSPTRQRRRSSSSSSSTSRRQSASQDDLSMPSSSWWDDRHSSGQDDNEHSSGQHDDDTNHGSSGRSSSNSRLQGAVNQALPMLVCNLAAHVGQLGAEDLALLLSAMAACRQMSPPVNDCISRARELHSACRRAITEDSHELDALWRLNEADEEWLDQELGLSIGGKRPWEDPAGVSGAVRAPATDAQLLDAVHAASLQLVAAGPAAVTAGAVARIVGAWGALGHPQHADQLVLACGMRRTST